MLLYRVIEIVGSNDYVVADEVTEKEAAKLFNELPRRRIMHPVRKIKGQHKRN